MTEPATPSVCPACGYTVGDGAIERCPECGAAVASFDSITQQRHDARIKWLARSVLVCACWPLLCGMAANGLLCIARLVLGRWPHRYGMDDPKDIPIVNVLGIPFLLLLIMIPVTAILGLVIWATAAYLDLRRSSGLAAAHDSRNAPRSSLGRVHWALGIGVLLWMVGVAVLYADPARVFVWLAD